VPEIISQPAAAYRTSTLPRKTGTKRAAEKAPVKLPMRSQSRDPVVRRTTNSNKPSSDRPVEIFLPKRQLNRSPTRDISPSSGSSSSPSRGRGRSVSPSRKPASSLLPSRHMKKGNVQVIRPLPKEAKPPSSSSSSSKLDEEFARLSLHRSQSDHFQKPPLKISVPYRRSIFSSDASSAQTTSPPPSFQSDYDSAGSSMSSPAPYRAPVMPVYPVKAQYSTSSANDLFPSGANREVLFTSYGTSSLNGATLTRIKVSHAPLLAMLTNRLDNLRSIHQMGTQKDLKVRRVSSIQLVFFFSTNSSEPLFFYKSHTDIDFDERKKPGNSINLNH
jgi:hypothetical protein